MRDQIFAIIKEALTDLNDELEYESLENITPQTQILGEEEGIDSLSLVRLIAVLEEEIESNFGSRIDMGLENFLEEEETPFKTVETVIAFVESNLKTAAVSSHP